MLRIRSLPGLALAAWASFVAFEGLLAAMAVSNSWHPHFLPVMPMLALATLTGLAILVAASWRMIRGPRRVSGLAWLLIGVAPLWLLAGHFLCGYAAKAAKVRFPDPLLKALVPLGDAVMDAEARFRYSQRTYGEKVVAISSPVSEFQARAETAAMDRHIRALEARLGRPSRWAVHWVRGPILGEEGKSHRGLSIGVRPGEWLPDAEGLSPTDRHEVAHGVIASFCGRSTDPPTVLIEGWAESNMGRDPILQALTLKESWERGHGIDLRQFTGPDWYHRREGAAYTYGAPLVDYILRRFGPSKFLELYTACREATFDGECRRILGLDVNGLDADFRAEIDRLAAEAGSLARYRLGHLRLAPGIAADDWEKFVADYFTSSGRMLELNRHVRLRVVKTMANDDAPGRKADYSEDQELLRSGESASLRHRTPYYELAYLAHPRRSMAAKRFSGESTWHVEPEPAGTSDQSRRRILYRIDILDSAGSYYVAPLRTLAQEPLHRDHLVAGFERITEDGRPRVRIRIEDRSPAGEKVPWRSMTYAFAVDDLYAAQVERIEGVGPKGVVAETNFTYEHHEGIPVLLAMHTATTAPDGSRGSIDQKVVERRFGMISEAEFDPIRYLDGPRVEEGRIDAIATIPPTSWIRFGLPFAIGSMSMVAGGIILTAIRRR